VTTRGYETAHLDDLDRIELVEMHGCEWRPIRRRFGIESFGTNAYTAAKPGDWIVEEHTESRLQHQELYFVVRGRARFTLDGEDLDAPAGTIVFIEDPSVKRVAVAEEEGTTVLAVGARPGEPFTPSAWEWWFEAYAKSPEEGVEIMRDGVRRLGDQAGLYYHLACMEARAGRKDDARTDLERAIELRPELREQAREDPDLEGVTT
jgi:mannose-6-phosphate isomerase-like protein (cupin superfamily)